MGHMGAYKGATGALTEAYRGGLQGRPTEAYTGTTGAPKRGPTGGAYRGGLHGGAYRGGLQGALEGGAYRGRL